MQIASFTRYKLAGLAKRTTKQRRPHTVARTGGRVVRGGDSEMAVALERALRSAERKLEPAARLTHWVHAFPARMHPATARKLVQMVLGDRARGRDRPTVLDPFCGSGTVLVEALHAGALASGVDLNPLAVAIATAKTWTASAARRSELHHAARRISAAALEEGKAARRAEYRPPAERAPRGVDAAARNRRLADWFAPHVRRELEFLAASIERLRRRDEELGVVLEVALSAVLYKVSRRASDTDSSRVDRRVARGAAARLFETRVGELSSGLSALARKAPAVARVCSGDARDLSACGFKEGGVDAIVTSPPYAGTYDYVDQHRLRLDFLGLDTRAFSAAEMGSRRGFRGNASERRRAHRKWERDLGAALSEMARVLAPAGRVVVMLGDSLAGSRAAFADEAVRAAAKDCFEIEAWAAQERPKLGGAELRAFGKRPKREHLFLLRK